MAAADGRVGREKRGVEESGEGPINMGSRYKNGGWGEILGEFSERKKRQKKNDRKKKREELENKGKQKENKTQITTTCGLNPIRKQERSNLGHLRAKITLIQASQ